MSLTSPDRLEGRAGPPAAPNNSLAVVLAISNIMFNLTDLATTLAALSKGLAEANWLVLGMSAALGLNVFASLLIMKALVVIVAVFIALVGARSASGARRNLAMSYLLTSTLFFYLVSLNNILWIVG